MCRSRCAGDVSAVSLATALDRGGATTLASGCRRDLGVDIVPIERAVGGEGGDGTVDPFEQGADLRAIISVRGRQHRGGDPAGVGVGGQMQFLPGPPLAAPVFLHQPVARPAQAQAGAVHEQVHRPRVGRTPRPRHLRRLGPAAEGAVVRSGEIEVEQVEDRADQPLGLAQG